MARVLASIYPDKALNCQNAASTGQKLIRFAGENHRFMVLRASDVIFDANHSRSLSQYLRDRIVLLGGTYAQGRDRYPSSGGYLHGVELLAHATESEISGPLHALPPLWSLLFGAIVSVVAYLIVFPFRYPLDLVASAILFLLFSFPTGLIAYRFGNTLIPIASSILALPIGIICEHIFECPLRDFSKSRKNKSHATG
jgi:CHASE2 domain-containing sensor protein